MEPPLQALLERVPFGSELRVGPPRQGAPPCPHRATSGAVQLYVHLAACRPSALCIWQQQFCAARVRQWRGIAAVRTAAAVKKHAMLVSGVYDRLSTIDSALSYLNQHYEVFAETHTEMLHRLGPEAPSTEPQIEQPCAARWLPVIRRAVESGALEPVASSFLEWHRCQVHGALARASVVTLLSAVPVVTTPAVDPLRAAAVATEGGRMALLRAGFHESVGTCNPGVDPTAAVYFLTETGEARLRNPATDSAVYYEALCSAVAQNRRPAATLVLRVLDGRTEVFLGVASPPPAGESVGLVTFLVPFTACAPPTFRRTLTWEGVLKNGGLWRWVVASMELPSSGIPLDQRARSKAGREAPLVRLQEILREHRGAGFDGPAMHTVDALSSAAGANAAHTDKPGKRSRSAPLCIETLAEVDPPCIDSGVLAPIVALMHACGTVLAMRPDPCTPCGELIDQMAIHAAGPAEEGGRATLQK